MPDMNRQLVGCLPRYGLWFTSLVALRAVGLHCAVLSSYLRHKNVTTNRIHLGLTMISAPRASFCTSKMMTEALDKVDNVDIDPDGTFKYILIRVYDKQKGDTEPSKVIVRGYTRAAYHIDIYEEVSEKLKPLGLETECEGGGRIKHSKVEKKILVYGFSQGFGKAEHQVTVDLIKERYPDYDVTWTNEGY